MPKTRLNQGHRDMLYNLAKSLVRCPKEQETADDAYLKATNRIYAMIMKRYPPNEMKVLKKYECAEFSWRLKLHMHDGVVTEWNPRRDDKATMPLQPSAWGKNTYQPDAETSAAISVSMECEKKLAAAIDAKLKDYQAFFASSHTFEDVVQIWPEAEQLRVKIGAAKIMLAVTPDVVARIRADIATRKKAA